MAKNRRKMLYTVVMSFRLIAGSTLWQLASQITMAALSILTVKFVAIGLTKELAGNYNSAYGYLQLFGILADFGLYAVAVNEMRQEAVRERVLGALLVLRSLILVLSLVTALAFAWLLPAWRGTPLPLGITIAALVPFFTLLAGMVRVVFQVTYRMHYVFLAEVTQRILTVTLIGLFIAAGIRGSNDLHIYHLFLFIGGVGAFVLFLISFVIGNTLIRIRPRWEKDMMVTIAKRALPYGLAFLCMALYRQFDVTLIALLRPDFELQNAYYGFVVRMMDMGFLLPTFLLNSVLPLIHGEEGRHLLRKTLLMILLLGIVSSLFALLWSRPLIELMTTGAYLSTAARPGSDTALRILSFPLLCNGIILFYFYLLLLRHEWRRLVGVMLFGGAVSVGINLMLIPSFGFVGAAVTSAIVHGLLVALFLASGFSQIVTLVRASDVCRLAAFALLLFLSLWMSAPFLAGEVRTVAGLALAAPVMLLLGLSVRLDRLLLR